MESPRAACGAPEGAMPAAGRSPTIGILVGMHGVHAFPGMPPGALAAKLWAS
jgi:hypothetical protein